ncbi:MAG: glycosyltransferase family 4 protein [Actinomycetota bacterium]|nr:glycosyltransferase family 4 protein [Actinomycetota bacterium]
MRVLLLHNRYRAEGGEERSVEEIARLLEERGHAVEVLERSSGELGRVRAAASLWHGGLDADAVARATRSLRADVVHAHNVHPLLGWRALAAGNAAGARVVLHLHNFRLFCAIGVAYRDGAPCFRCRGGSTRPGLRLRCRGSLPESAAYAAGLHRQLAPLLRHADRLVTVSDATLRQLVALGVPAGQIVSLPNFVPASAFVDRSRADQGRHALVAGRLVPEKGFDTAVLACRTAGVPLVVAGEGPDEPRLRRLADGADVRFAGMLAREELARVRADAALVLAPSRSDDACPYAVVEALAAGVPVIASDRGGLPELAAASGVEPAEDLGAWTRAVARAWKEPDDRLRRGEAALALARDRCHPDVYYERLMGVYED